jgi:hypothetical protein
LIKFGILLRTLPGHSTNGADNILYKNKNPKTFPDRSLQQAQKLPFSELIEVTRTATTKSKSNLIAPKGGILALRCRNQLAVNSR